jgi:hypothetical protein
MMQANIAPLATMYGCLSFWTGSSNNVSYVGDDPAVKRAKDQMAGVLTTGSQAEADKVFKELLKHELNQAWYIPRVEDPLYPIWWPWLKNYHGETQVGYWNDKSATRWVWIDQDVKGSMGHWSPNPTSPATWPFRDSAYVRAQRAYAASAPISNGKKDIGAWAKRRGCQ